MRKAIFAAAAAVAVFTSAATAADITFGIDGELSIRSKKTTNVPDEGDESFDKYSGTEFYLMPRLGIRTSEKLELSPYLGFGIDSYKYTRDLAIEEEYENTTKQVLLGAGFGANFYAVTADRFELSMGPRFNWKMRTTPKHGTTRKDKETGNEVKVTEYDTFRDNTFSIDAPVNFDFFVGDVFGIRLGMKLAEFSVRTNKSRDKDAPVEDKGAAASFRLLGMNDNDEEWRLPLNLGVFFRF